MKKNSQSSVPLVAITPVPLTPSMPNPSEAVIPLMPDDPNDVLSPNQVHVLTLSLPSSTLILPFTQSMLQPQPNMGLLASEWSFLISKVQTEGHTLIPAMPSLASAAPVDSLPLSKVFTVEAASFSLEPEPSALPDCLIQMAAKHVFIPLSMLTTVVLNDIETNKM